MKENTTITQEENNKTKPSTQESQSTTSNKHNESDNLFPTIHSSLLSSKINNGRKAKKCTLKEYDDINYLDVDLLNKFLSERKRLLPARITGVSAKKQRKLKAAVQKARYLGLLPYTKI